MKQIKTGLRESLPIAAGYLPVAFTFGVTTVQAGFSPWVGVLISVVVFAGGSQFMLISLLASGGSLFTTAPAVWMLNARHLLYGHPVLKLLRADPRPVPAPWLAFGLTDEVFATSITRLEHIPVHERKHWYLGLQWGAYLSWVAGTVLGCFAGAEILSRWPALKAIFEFILPAFFFALLLNMPSRHAIFTALVSAIITAAMLLKLSAATAIPLGLLLGAGIGTLYPNRRIDSSEHASPQVDHKHNNRNNRDDCNGGGNDGNDGND